MELMVTAPDPKPKKNRELKTEILPIGLPTSTPTPKPSTVSEVAKPLPPLG